MLFRIANREDTVQIVSALFVLAFLWQETAVLNFKTFTEVNVIASVNREGVISAAILVTMHWNQYLYLSESLI